MRRTANLVVLLFVVLLNGCSFLGANLASTRTISITKSPYRVTVSGDVHSGDERFITRTLGILAQTPYVDHTFTDTKIFVLGSETEIDDIRVDVEKKEVSNDNSISSTELE